MTFNFNNIIDAYGGNTPLIKIYGSNDYLLWQKYKPTPEVPEVPVFSCNNNIVTITCSTPNAEIRYRDIHSPQWIKYTTPFKIIQTTQWIAYSTKNGVDSSYSEPFTAAITIPADPVITCVNNVVTISCSTTGSTLRYRWVSPMVTSWLQSSSSTTSFNISSDITIEAYSVLNGINSENTVRMVCEVVKPDGVVIECHFNEVIITCATSDASIYYSIDGGSYSLYTEAFEIEDDCNISAYSKKYNISSSTSSLLCTFIEGLVLSPWVSATYGKYNLPISQYSQFTDISQLTNTTTKTPINNKSDRVRFILYNNKILLELSDYTLATFTSGNNAYRLNSNDLYTTSNISRAYQLYLSSSDKANYINISHDNPNWLGNIFKTYSSRQMDRDINTIGVKRFYQGQTYIGDYSGTATTDFGVPQINSTSTGSFTANTFAKFMQTILSRVTQANTTTQSGVLANGNSRFETFNKYNTKNEYPFNLYFGVSSMNGITFYPPYDKHPYLYNAYYIELN